ncbi:MAG TPA: enoyl-CoA hydratase/isomerase family protein [Terriglobales bacterium]|jgi:cyclohexa-1,5-dienecarbonyl-CoA hydratase
MTMPATTHLTRIALDVHAPVARLTLHKPPLNIIDIPMMEELADALDAIESNPRIAVIVISGSTNFSVGVDIAAHIPAKIQEMLSKFHGVIMRLVTSKKVTVATVLGHCLGGGAELAMVSDLVYTSESAIWGFPEIKLACYPPVAATALAALVGQKHASDLILTGRTINGKEAATMGLANLAVPSDQVDTALGQALDHLLTLSPAALAVTKKAIYAWDSIHFDKGLARAEKIYLEELMKTSDVQEGVNAFMEKRTPSWTGK